jgi:hypothetical protein
VNPKASETAKDFAKFLAAPGLCEETFRKHGYFAAPQIAPPTSQP